MTFDPYSWPGKLYYPDVSRTQAEQMLQTEPAGTFIIRQSSTQPGYSLSVREPGESGQAVIRHYLIIDLTRLETNPEQGYQIGEQKFPDMPSLLNFYKTHMLEDTHLIRPMHRQLQKVIAKFPFPGVQESDLPFKKGETLSILNKNDDNWWTAQNDLERTGLIPANFVEMISNETLDTSLVNLRNSSFDDSFKSDHNRNSSTVQTNSDCRDSNSSSGSAVEEGQPTRSSASAKRKLPDYAKVVTDRNPSAYDKTNLRLRIGDVIKVTKTNPNGTWEGELNGKKGKFPFTYIEWLENNDNQTVNNNAN